jgi:hypothetical protein
MKKRENPIKNETQKNPTNKGARFEIREWFNRGFQRCPKDIGGLFL